jgi:hypothetical protein
MNELPRLALQAKNAGDADRYGHKLIAAANLGSPPFHLDDAREVLGCVCRKQFRAGDFSIPVMRRGAG